MSIDSVSVRAPSNIALSKYMGKVDSTRNIPENPSLSMTLSNLCTDLTVTGISDSADRLSLEKPHWSKGIAPSLSSVGQEKFLKHIERVRQAIPEIFKTFGLTYRPTTQKIQISSANTFPHGSGIASSASSFAALTLGVVTFYSQDRKEFSKFFSSQDPRAQKLRQKLASLSREGSGSSCRSFDGPFVSWQGESVQQVESRLEPLVDLILIAGSEEKKVSSSQAHQVVKESPLWKGRVLRAQNRHGKIFDAITEGQFEVLAETSWGEFQDMHDLFHTAKPAFTYWNDSTRTMLEKLSRFPIDQVCLTMDAGPNVHCLVREKDAKKVRARLETLFPGVEILEDRAGSGASVVEV